MAKALPNLWVGQTGQPRRFRLCPSGTVRFCRLPAESGLRSLPRSPSIGYTPVRAGKAGGMAAPDGPRAETGWWLWWILAVLTGTPMGESL